MTWHVSTGCCFCDTVTNTSQTDALDSYDDANFLAHTATGKYVVKVHNGADSAPGTRGFSDAMNLCMAHLTSHGIYVNHPVLNTQQLMSTVVKLPVAHVRVYLLSMHRSSD